jgi:hypothetical protein
VYALSIDDGTTKPGWPVDIAANVPGFVPGYQNDRGALIILDGTLYVPYASVNGDCGTWHGWIVGISTTDPTQVQAFRTTAPKGGIWSALTSDGTSLFASTGNTVTGTTTWGGGEGFLRFTAGPTFSGATSDYFSPSNWEDLDRYDVDLGCAAAILFDMPGVTPPHLAAAMGKFGVVHLLDRDNLGGIGTGNGITGEGLFSLAVTSGQSTFRPDEIRGTASTYTTAKGRYLALGTVARDDVTLGTVAVCPKGTSGNMVALSVTATSPPTLVPAWCAETGGSGSPIATTTDGKSNPLVWAFGGGTVGGNWVVELHAFDGDTGAVVFSGTDEADQMGYIYEWASPVVAKGRIVVGGNYLVYEYKTP